MNTDKTTIQFFLEQYMTTPCSNLHPGVYMTFRHQYIDSCFCYDQ